MMVPSGIFIIPGGRPPLPPATGVRAELPDGGEFPNGQVYGADSLMAWVSRNWFGVVGSGDFAHYLAGTRVERLKTIKGAFAYAGKRYMAKKEEMPVMEQKPGRYRSKQKAESKSISAFPISAFCFCSQLWSQDFTAKLFCNVEFWLECLPRLIGPLTERGNCNSEFRA